MLSVSESPVTVRRAVVDDAPEMARTHVQAWRESYREIFASSVLEGLSVNARTSAWQSSLANPDVAAWIVVIGSRVVGFASLQPAEGDEDPSTTAELAAMYVLRSHWGQGLGRRLMDNFVAELLPRGFRQAVLWVLRDNFRARRFYQIAGWWADGGSKDHFGGHHAMAVRYRFKPEMLKVVRAIPSDGGGG